MGPALAQLVEHLTVVVSTFLYFVIKGKTKYIFIKVNIFGSTFLRWICGYQNVAGSNPASRKLLINIIKNTY